ncbi:hypothetical protein EQM14_03810 [Caproiciproducens sp. NJN-50]|uniref:hypothetical protein n=1 Tax=Caproiciproducens sp. NJN-50 TaxID=2507162 RepID=UPI000FFE2A09|nr:hypothetical protein [Caproiciproducens sp. NJN-50]QAT48969.1 hypothetical protein EQM14_03810 [Caproiciproducens sp. NJN-50]
MALSAVVSPPAFAEQINSPASPAAAPGESAKANPLDTGKNILYYLFWTKDAKLESDLANLQKSLDLSSKQMAELEAVGLSQFQATRSPGNSAKSGDVKAFNASVEAQAAKTNQEIQSALKDSYPGFRNWIKAWWQGERDYRNNAVESAMKPDAGITTHTIYATQYVPDTSGATEVALPDKYIKSANLGSSSPYKNPPYTVTVRSSAATLSNVRVEEAGPWNENDNYWDTARRTWNGRLTLGTPEAYAAFYDNFNNGKDEFGDTVLNPAGIDLSTAAARAIGLGANKSGWIVVTFSDLP